MLILLETSHELGIAAITTGCESGRQISGSNALSRLSFARRLYGHPVDGVLLWIYPGGQSDSSEGHASNDPELAHSPANVGDAG